MSLLRQIEPDEVPKLRRLAVDGEALRIAAEILSDVQARGDEALLQWAQNLGDLQPGEPALIEPDAFVPRSAELDDETRALLDRTIDRVTAFAEAQRKSVQGFEAPVPGGVAAQEVVPIERSGCYAPGGRYPLPSSAIMTAATAKAAGVRSVTLASPRPGPALFHVAERVGVDRVLAVGGAQAVAAMAYGTATLPACDGIVGPGNAFVTAAKQLVSGVVRIDMLAGPSELLILTDDSADPRVVAADLLAQAEHDTQAIPILASTSARLIRDVDAELARQLKDLPTGDTARAALGNGFAVLAADDDQLAEISDRIAAEHLQVHVADPSFTKRLKHFGAAFVGERSAEVFGDYGFGPNHTLPTGGTARSFGGLSVFDFLRIRTTLTVENPSVAGRDAAAFGRLEGLEAHARSAEVRLERAK